MEEQNWELQASLCSRDPLSRRFAWLPAFSENRRSPDVTGARDLEIAGEFLSDRPHPPQPRYNPPPISIGQQLATTTTHDERFFFTLRLNHATIDSLFLHAAKGFDRSLEGRLF